MYIEVYRRHHTVKSSMSSGVSDNGAFSIPVLYQFFVQELGKASVSSKRDATLVASMMAYSHHFIIHVRGNSNPGAITAVPAIPDAAALIKVFFNNLEWSRKRNGKLSRKPPSSVNGVSFCAGQYAGFLMLLCQLSKGRQCPE
mgnify:CR=1 FL=1